MKRKGWVVCIGVLFAFFCLSSPCFASESDDLRDFAHTEDILNALPEGFDKEELATFFQEEERADPGKLLWEKILSYATLGLQEGLGFFGKICGMILAAALFQCIKKSIGSEKLEDVFDFLLILALGTTCFSALEDCFSVTRVALASLADFMAVSVSVMTVLYSVSGSVSTAAASFAGIRFVLAFLTQGIAKMLFPVLKALFGLSLALSLKDLGLSGLLSFFKKGIRTVIVFFFTVVSAMLALQHALAVASDSMTMRSVRFAAGNFIPVVGSFVGESTKTLAASLSLVKTQCGVVCLIVLICTVLQPILYVWVHKTFLNLGKGLGELFGEKSCTSFLGGVSNLMDLMLALLISQGCYFIFFITLFLSTKGSI